jgi:hypothetical protein
MSTTKMLWNFETLQHDTNSGIKITLDKMITTPTDRSTLLLTKK